MKEVAGLFQKEYQLLDISSPSFPHQGRIPKRFTCDGENLNPALMVKDVPASAKSFVLIVDDPDAPNGTWLHWLVWNIPPDNDISENTVPGIQGFNDFKRSSYGGPCPPSGTHRYFFRLYALDDLLDLPAGSDRKSVEKAMRTHIVGYGELVGTYERLK